MKDKECAGGNHFEKNVCLFLYLSEYKPMVLKNDDGMFIKKNRHIPVSKWLTLSMTWTNNNSTHMARRKYQRKRHQFFHGNWIHVSHSFTCVFYVIVYNNKTSCFLICFQASALTISKLRFKKARQVGIPRIHFCQTLEFP
jgi:DNA repair exonuclease SbcCD nuclease subunit